MATYDPKKANEAQLDYIVKHPGLPHFAPSHGQCYFCYNQIYDRISVEEAGSRLITGCPFCHKSYCE